MCIMSSEGWHWQVVWVEIVEALNVIPKFWTYDCVAIKKNWNGGVMSDLYFRNISQVEMWRKVWLEG